MYKLIEHLWTEPPQRTLILEPLSCIFKIILLQYKPPGTKISLSKNGVSFSHPSYVQGLFRGAYGDCREDLHNLYHPLRQCLQWYDSRNKTYKHLYVECAKGLQTLKDVYTKDSTIHHTINHYLRALEDPSILDKDTPITSEPEPTPDTDPDTTPEHSGLPTTNPLIEHLRNIWTDPEIKLSYDLVVLLQSCPPSMKDTYCRTLEDIIDAKEKELYHYIQHSTTSY